MELAVTGGGQHKKIPVDLKKMRLFGDGNWWNLLRAVKPKDGPDARAVRAGGTNWAVLVIFL